jgi:hypothetical protein
MHQLAGDFQVAALSARRKSFRYSYYFDRNT